MLLEKLLLKFQAQSSMNLPCILHPTCFTEYLRLVMRKSSTNFSYKRNYDKFSTIRYIMIYLRFLNNLCSSKEVVYSYPASTNFLASSTVAATLQLYSCSIKSTDCFNLSLLSIPMSFD